MSRGRKIAVIVAASLAGLILIVFVAGISIVQTDWFHNFVREKIVSSVETATGGKVEVGSFSFDWRHLRAQVRNFVIHGSEPSDGPPLFRANLLDIQLKLLSPFKGMVDIASLLVDTPQANIIAYPDGRTNIPAPKVQHSSNKSGLESIVDLAVGRFNVQNGSFTFAGKKTDLNASGEKLRAQLAYNPLHPSYTGEIDMSPLHIQSGNNAPVDVEIKLPLTLASDSIVLAGGQLNTPGSRIALSGSMDHLVAPRTSAHVTAQIALDEVRRAAGLALPLDTVHGPGVLSADITGSMDDQRIQVQNARINLGQSQIAASGTLGSAANSGAMQFNSTLSLAEIGRLLRVAARPDGVVRLGGQATMAAAGEYRVTANLNARNVAVGQGAGRIAGITLDSGIIADPRRIELGGLRLTALGGSFAGSGALEQMETVRLSGKLRGFDIQRLARAFAPQAAGYSGSISGDVQAAGNIKNTSDLMARVKLDIAPGTQGVPVSGRLNVDYAGRADTVTLAPSYVALPHTRLDLAGSLGQQIQVRLVTRDMADFKPVASVPVTFNGGSATVTATVTGKLDAPRIAAQADVVNFVVDGRPFTKFDAALAASPSGASVTNAVLSRGALQAQFSASVGLRNWKPEPNQALRADASMRNADLADVLALAGQSDVPATGALTADVHVDGTIGDPRGNADLTVNNGTLEGEHFDSLITHAVMTDRSIDIPTLQWIAGPSRIDANASYQHAVNELMRGTLHARVNSNQIQLAQFQSLVKERPGLKGIVALNAEAAAAIQPAPVQRAGAHPSAAQTSSAQASTAQASTGGTQFQLTSLNANVSARGLQMEGKNYGDFSATATSAGSTVQYNVTSDFAGSNIRVNGQSALAGDHDTTANAQISNLPIERALAFAGRHDLPVTGTLSATAQVSGTLQNPRATANLNINNGSAYDEPFNRFLLNASYSNQSIDVQQMRLEQGPANLELSASLTHPPNDLQDGQVRFHVRSNQIQLAQIHTIQKAKTGLAGAFELSADGAATLRRNDVPLFSTLNANLAAKGLSVDKKPVGDLTATAETRGGAVEFNLSSNFARSNIRGNGRMQLSGDYPVNARLNFAGVTWSGLQSWTGGSARPMFDALVEGQVSVDGPAAHTDALRATLQLAKLEAHSVTPATGAKPRVTFELHNAEPVVVALNNSVVTIQSARIVGPFTNLALSGNASIRDQQKINIRADGNVNLELLKAFDPNVFSSGAVVLNAAVAGTLAAPTVNGRLQLQNASFNMVDLPNGLSNANGSVVFSGTEARIQDITGQSGGGKLTLAGAVNYGGPEMQFRLQATVDHVHVAYPETVTTEVSARLSLTGATASSLLSGTVRISQVALHSHSDMGSILSGGPEPPSSPANSTGLMAGMRFDVRILTASGAQFRTSLTQNLQADADLTLRGNPDHPGMLGRVSVTQGDVVFFGSQYTINQGTISFFDPSKIEPILNVGLQTKVQGIEVTLGVSGPIDRMKLSYSSDPPLQLNEIVALLASGKTPTSDPVLAARAQTPPKQSVTQEGASMLMGQAVASPVSGRLQRLFGVSKLKIDPTMNGTSSTPQATLTLQQQITRDLTFTYIQDVTKGNPAIIRMEWAINPRWSAIAAREVNGEFNVDMFYKKRFR